MEGGEEKRLRFWSYEPVDEELRKYWTGPRDVESEVATVVQEEEARMRSFTEKFKEESFVKMNLVPKKANWDLKRNIGHKIARLERQTQRALVELAEERALRPDSTMDLARVVRNAHASLPDQADENDLVND